MIFASSHAFKSTWTSCAYYILGKHPRIPQVKLAEENDEYLVLVMHDATDHFGFQYWFKQAVGSWGCGFRMPGDGCQPSIR